MKFLFILIALAFCGTPLLAQEKPEQKPADARKQIDPQPRNAAEGFIDENGDGVDDRVRSNPQSGERANGDTRQQRRQRRDRFIDQDGDGINDNRCSGTGLRQGKRCGAAKGCEK